MKNRLHNQMKKKAVLQNEQQYVAMKQIYNTEYK